MGTLTDYELDYQSGYEVKRIRAFYRRGFTPEEIGDMFYLDSGYVYYVINAENI